MYNLLKKYRTCVLIISFTCPVVLFSLFGAVLPASAHRAESAHVSVPTTPGAWAGYFVHNDSPNDYNRFTRITGVHARVTVPCLSDTQPGRGVSAWIGLGGIKSNSLVRARISLTLDAFTSTTVRFSTITISIRLA